METQIIEGTFAEVQQLLRELHLNSGAHLRLTVTEIDESPDPEALFANSPRRNGLILVPVTDLATSEMVQNALYNADMEDALGVDWDENPAHLRVVHKISPGAKNRK